MFSEIDAETAVNRRDTNFEIVEKQDSSYPAQKELYIELLNLDVSNLQGEMPAIERSHLFVQLTSEQLKNVSSIQSLSFPVDDSGQIELGGALLFSSDNLKIDWKNGTVTEKFHAVEPMFDDQRIVMYPSVSGRGHTFYTVPILYSSSVTNAKGASYDVGVQRELVVRYDTSTKKYEIIGFGSGIENGMVRANADKKPQPGHVITPLYLTISDDATNEPIGLTQYVDKEGKPIPLMSVAGKVTDPNTGKPLFMKWKAGTPFIYTKDSLITNKPIKSGTFFYGFTFNSPGGDSAGSYPGVIAVRNGNIFRFTTEEFAKAIAEVANTSK